MLLAMTPACTAMYAEIIISETKNSYISKTLKRDLHSRVTLRHFVFCSTLTHFLTSFFVKPSPVNLLDEQ